MRSAIITVACVGLVVCWPRTTLTDIYTDTPATVQHLEWDIPVWKAHTLIDLYI